MADLEQALSRVDAGSWIESPTQQSRVSWLPLWLISSSGLWVGLDRHARWIVGRLSGQASEPSGKLSPSWLPLLDHDESVVEEELAYAGAKYNLPVDALVQSLPMDDIIVLALSGSNAHWIDRALTWLETRNISGETRTILGSLASSRPAGQKARQRARRLRERGEGVPTKPGAGQSDGS